MVHVKKSAMCRLAYSKAYMAIFHAHACCLKCTGLQCQNQWSWKQETFYMQTFPSIVFEMFALFKILLKICKMCAQTASLFIFPTDAFLPKLVGIDVQQADVTGRHMFKHIFAIFGAS